MNVKIKSKVSGKLNWLRVYDKAGNLKHEVKDIPNLLFNAALTGGTLGAITNSSSFVDNSESYEDLNGTWDQSGNTVTRATGTGTFPSSTTHVGNELKWNTGERCHVTARASDTSITVSGPARTITGGTIRRYLTNGQAWWGSQVQSSTSATQISNVLDATAGTRVMVTQVNFPSATSAYSLGSLYFSGNSRVKMPSPISIDVDDQIQAEYTRTETVTGRSQTYELGVESVGIPTGHSMLTIVGSGSNVDVTFSGATHFLAGDKLDLRNIIPKKFVISSASSTSTTFTINTTAAHGLNPGDSIQIEDASLVGYNGTHTIDTVPDTDTVTITNAANPGAMGASGTIRLTTPATYFDDLGLATIASMVSSSVARITSTITGPAVNPVTVTGDPGVTVRYKRGGTSGDSSWVLATNSAGASRHYTEANAQALVNDTAAIASPTPGSGPLNDLAVSTSPSHTNDFTRSNLLTWNAGTGTGQTRIKQIQTGLSGEATGSTWCQITFNTPFTKLEAHRFRCTTSKQLLRDLP